MLGASVHLLFLSLCGTVRASYSVHKVAIAANGGTATNASGEVTIFISNQSETTGMYTIFAVGSVSGLEPDLSESNCSDSTFLSCGIHIHDEETLAFLADDPSLWYSNRYTSTTSEGEAAVNFIVDIDRGDIAGRFLAIHPSVGGFSYAAGGFLVQETSDVWSVTTAEIDSSGVEGSAILFTSGTTVMGAGMASGLPANVTDCSATNGCGAHVHSGTSCGSTSDQGGHYYNSDEDPWATTGYTSTDSDGDAKFVFSAESEGVDIDGRTFIVHLDDGTRASCGIISPAPTPAPTMSPTMSPTTAGINETMSPTMSPTTAGINETMATTTEDPPISGATSRALWASSLMLIVFHFVPE